MLEKGCSLFSCLLRGLKWFLNSNRHNTRGTLQALNIFNFKQHKLKKRKLNLKWPEIGFWKTQVVLKVQPCNSYIPSSLKSYQRHLHIIMQSNRVSFKISVKSELVQLRGTGSHLPLLEHVLCFLNAVHTYK